MANKDVILHDDEENDLYPVTRTSNVYDSSNHNLDELLAGKQASLSTSQLNAVNSGVTSSTVAQVATNTNNIAQLSNPNLLINGDFRVNQRGASTYTGSGSRLYTVDRWCITSSASVTSINSNSISVTLSAQYQAFEQKIEDYEKLKGKTMTLSCKISNVAISSGNQLFLRYNSGDTTGTKQITGDGTYSLTFTVSNSATLLAVQIFSGSGSGITYSFDLEWMKLELGSIATPFSPRPYAEELALCQRYFLMLNNDNKYAMFGSGFVYSDTRAFSIIPTPVSMRTKPTLAHSNLVYLMGGAKQNISSISIDRLNLSSISIRVDSSNLIAGQAGTLYIDNSSTGYLALDAEIY